MAGNPGKTESGGFWKIQDVVARDLYIPDIVRRENGSRRGVGFVCDIDYLEARGTRGDVCVIA